MNENYDAVIIGTGQAGKPLALSLADADWKVAIIERDLVGGSCINVGCSPTKAMVSSARVAHLTRRASDYGVIISDMNINMKVIKAKKQKIVDSFRDGSTKRLESHKNIDLIMGEAKFKGENSLEINLLTGDKLQLTSEKIFINVGCRPDVPSIPGINQIAILNSSTIMELEEVPEHLLVLGGGYIGLEFGQMFRRFGSKVTIIHRGTQLLSREDTDIAEEVANIFQNEGIEVILNAEATEINQSDDSDIVLTYKSDSTEKSVSGTHLLIATGRVPNSESLNLKSAGVETTDKGYIIANEKLETNVPGIFSLGDVKGGPQFTHISYDDFRIIRSNLLEGENASTAGRLGPYVVFIDPQLVRIGMTEKEVEKAGYNYKVAKIPMSHVARALETDETNGFMKAIVDIDTKQILGGAILGVEGGEVMSVLQVAMMGKLPYTVLKEGIFAHPTFSESLNNLFMAMDMS